MLFGALLFTRSDGPCSFEKVYYTALLLSSSNMTFASIFFMLCVWHISARYVHLLLVDDDTEYNSDRPFCAPGTASGTCAYDLQGVEYQQLSAERLTISPASKMHSFAG